jgi:threonine dehydrogenase-like Zn-dependent dehydrogenase
LTARIAFEKVRARAEVRAMRAVRIEAGAVRVVEVPAPSGDGVRVRIRSAGICGSDLHMLRKNFPLAGTLGHELAGELDDGTPVAIEPITPCGRCGQCREGAYNRCEKGPAVILGVGQDGGMADEVRVPERCLVPLPRGVAARDACLVEPLAVAVHGIASLALGPERRVLVVGGGAIGLCAVAAAAATGARVTLEARHDAQRAAGDALGARVAAGGEGFDAVVDAAGTPQALERAVEACKPGGALALVASYWDGLALPPIALPMKEVRVFPALMYACAGPLREIEVAAQLLASKPEIARRLITHRFPLEAAPEAFRAAEDRRGGALKVVLEP